MHCCRQRWLFDIVECSYNGRNCPGIDKIPALRNSIYLISHVLTVNTQKQRHSWGQQQQQQIAAELPLRHWTPPRACALHPLHLLSIPPSSQLLHLWVLRQSQHSSLAVHRAPPEVLQQLQNICFGLFSIIYAFIQCGNERQSLQNPNLTLFRCNFCHVCWFFLFFLVKVIVITSTCALLLLAVIIIAYIKM